MDTRTLLVDAYTKFHDKAEATRGAFPGLTSFDILERVSQGKGTFGWMWGVGSEIQETINTANAWGIRLHLWGVWNGVMPELASDDERWEVANHFIEPIAFFCMLQPSSLSERLVVASETALHQANLRVFPGEPDSLDQDKLRPGAVLRKGDRRKQLDRLGSRWTSYRAFRDALAAMNGKGYQGDTRNFRDLSAHSFAPRLHMGIIARAIRSIEPWAELVPQADGTVVRVPHPTKKGVSYAMWDVPALDLQTMQTANLAEYRLARSAMGAFIELIGELCDRIGAIAPTASAPADASAP